MNKDKCKRNPVCMSTAGKCNWCNNKRAVISDGTYVYCSKECKEKFLKNAMEAMRDPYSQLGDNDE